MRSAGLPALRKPSAELSALFKAEPHDAWGIHRVLDPNYEVGVLSPPKWLYRREVRLDDEPLARLPGRSDDAEDPSWSPPRWTPGFDGDVDLPYEAERDRSEDPRFALHVAPGEHQLVVSYSTSAGAYFCEPTLCWQLPYVLAPAKTWGGFGGLDVTVRVPEAWRFASEPALAPDGEAMRATFTELPANALAMTLQAPATAGYRAAGRSVDRVWARRRRRARVVSARVRRADERAR